MVNSLQDWLKVDQISVRDSSDALADSLKVASRFRLIATIKLPDVGYLLARDVANPLLSSFHLDSSQKILGKYFQFLCRTPVSAQCSSHHCTAILRNSEVNRGACCYGVCCPCLGAQVGFGPAAYAFAQWRTWVTVHYLLEGAFGKKEKF